MIFTGEKELELSIILPCLNEEKAVGHCINEARKFIGRRNVNAEIVVVDNDSTDNSTKVALSQGARVVYEKRRGYGSALRAGIREARGEVIILADADTTYDLEHLDGIYDALASGRCDMVIGNRMNETTEKGAISVFHRLGAEMLSACGRLIYKVKVRDFHCGLRGIRRDAAERLQLESDGMEFATEMIAMAAREEMRIGQLSVGLRKCKCDRKSKMRAIEDGWRHLSYMLFFRRTCL